MTLTHENAKDRCDAYLRVTEWARRRYTVAGVLTTTVGFGVAGRPGPMTHMIPSRYSLIEDLAAHRYLGCKLHWPTETLATAYAA
jgi:hypothetical protein